MTFFEWIHACLLIDAKNYPVADTLKEKIGEMIEEWKKNCSAKRSDRPSKETEKQ